MFPPEPPGFSHGEAQLADYPVNPKALALALRKDAMDEYAWNRALSAYHKLTATVLWPAAVFKSLTRVAIVPVLVASPPAAEFFSSLWLAVLGATVAAAGLALLATTGKPRP